jgi:hypothetical protein
MDRPYIATRKRKGVGPGWWVFIVGTAGTVGWVRTARTPAQLRKILMIAARRLADAVGKD